MKRGEIWQAQLPPAPGHVQAGARKSLDQRLDGRGLLEAQVEPCVERSLRCIRGGIHRGGGAPEPSARSHRDVMVRRT